MKRTFIETQEFTKKWTQLGLSDENLRILENSILENPQIGKIIKGTGKLRKMRYSLPGRGKRGSARVCYVDFLLEETVYMITIYAKNEKENLSQKERNDIKRAIEILENSLKEERL